MAHNVTDRKRRFNNVRSDCLMIHDYNIVSSRVQINLVAWQSKKLRLMAPLCIGMRCFYGTDQSLCIAERWLSGRKHRTRNAACR